MNSELLRIPLSLRIRRFAYSCFLGIDSPLSMKVYWNYVERVLTFLETEGSDLISCYKNTSETKGEIGTRVWTMWYQGLENAPELVKNCIRLMEKAVGPDLVVLDKDNISAYFKPAEHIQKLFDNGNLGIQNYSDYVRNGILAEYGGTWMDATIFLTDSDYISSYCNKAFHTVCHAPKKYEGMEHGRWSTFFIAGAPSCPVFQFVRDYYEFYYLKFSESVDYFMTDFLYLVAYRNIPEVKRLIETCHVENKYSVFSLVGLLDNPFDEYIWNDRVDNNYVYKLVWKRQFKKGNTMYSAFLHYNK